MEEVILDVRPQSTIFNLSEKERKKTGIAARGILSKTEFRMVEMATHPDQRFFVL